jgi:uncharacterized metal-binding protein YceD (DUF177 family)
MVKEKDFDIPFSGLKLGKHLFSFDIVDAFFELFDYSEIKKGTVKVNVTLDKKVSMLTLDFEVTGTVELLCDTCAEAYSQQLNEHFNLIVKFSDLVESSDSDEIIILSTKEHRLSLAQYIYEFIHLSLPTRRTHPSYDECNSEMIEHIQQYGIIEPTTNDETIDPRWASLNKIKKALK